MAVAGSLLGQRCKGEELASPVVPLQEVEEVALTAVLLSKAQEPVVALVASLLVSLVSVLDSRACIRVCHRMNASVPENAFSDFVNHDHGGGGAFDIPLPRE